MPVTGPRWPEKMEQIKIYVENYFFEHRAQPSVALIAKTLGLGESTAGHYIAEMKRRGMIENRKRGIITKEMRREMERADKAAHGHGCLSSFDSLTAIPHSIFGEDLYAIKVLDDSMKGASICKGDTLLVRRQNTAEDGEIIIARADGWNVIGRYYREDHTGKAVIHRENMRMADIHSGDCRIFGVVAHVIHYMPEIVSTNTEEKEEYRAVRCGREELVPVRMMDDSMSDAGIRTGDMLLVRKKKTVEPGDIVIASISGINVIGRIRINEYRTKPSETTLCTGRFSKPFNIDDCEVIGTVVHVFHQLQPEMQKASAG